LLIFPYLNFTKQKTFCDEDNRKYFLKIRLTKLQAATVPFYTHICISYQGREAKAKTKARAAYLPLFSHFFS